VRVRVLSAVVVLVAGSYLLVSADPWDPLAGRLGLGAWAVGAFAVGLVAQGTERRGAVVLGAVLPAVAIAASLPFSRAEEPFTWGFFMLPLLGVGGAALVLVAAVVARSLRRDGRPARAVGAVELTATVLAACAFGYGVWSDQRVIDRHPGRPSTIDDVRGTFRGVGPGDPSSVLRRRLGAPVVARIPAVGFGTPLGESRGDFVGPSGSSGEVTWRYRGLAVVTDRERAEQLVVTDAAAQTPAGVGVGDSLAVASRAYRHLVCDGEITGSDASNPEYPTCSGHLAGRHGITFYGDPIESISLEGGASGPRVRRR
jgi:hypothetical protein